MMTPFTERRFKVKVHVRDLDAMKNLLRLLRDQYNLEPVGWRVSPAFAPEGDSDKLTGISRILSHTLSFPRWKSRAVKNGLIDLFRQGFMVRCITKRWWLGQEEDGSRYFKARCPMAYWNNKAHTEALGEGYREYLTISDWGKAQAEN